MLSLYRDTVILPAEVRVDYSKNPHKKTGVFFWEGGFRLILFLYIRCFQQNQPENVLKVTVHLERCFQFFVCKLR